MQLNLKWGEVRVLGWKYARRWDYLKAYKTKIQNKKM